MRECGETDEKRGEHDSARCGQHVDHHTPLRRVVISHSRGVDAGPEYLDGSVLAPSTFAKTLRLPEQRTF